MSELVGARPDIRLEPFIHHQSNQFRMFQELVDKIQWGKKANLF